MGDIIKYYSEINVDVEENLEKTQLNIEANQQGVAYVTINGYNVGTVPLKPINLTYRLNVVEENGAFKILATLHDKILFEPSVLNLTHDSMAIQMFDLNRIPLDDNQYSITDAGEVQ